MFVQDRAAKAETLVAELTETALPLILGQGVRSASIDVELDLWQSLRRALRQEPCGATGRRGALEVLTESAYQVALRHGLKGSFLDLELGLWAAFREAGRTAPLPCVA